MKHDQYALRITNVIKGEFKKLEDLNDEDVLLTYGTSLEVFYNEFNWMSEMDDDLFTYGLKKVHEITFCDHDEIDYENETHDERQVLCETHELLVCNMRIFKMIKYSFGQDEEYVAVKEDEYDDLTRTSNDARRAYQEIFQMMDEGWMVTRAE
ncbi:hypothetical protein Tco_0278610 [Tanacetum coccineum]